jgi:hypothetical protein
MRTPLILLSCVVLLAAGCASRKSDSLYRPVETAVSHPSTAPLGDDADQDREHLENAQKARAESLREQRKNNDDDGDN